MQISPRILELLAEFGVSPELLELPPAPNLWRVVEAWLAVLPARLGAGTIPTRRRQLACFVRWLEAAGKARPSRSRRLKPPLGLVARRMRVAPSRP